MLLKHLVVVVFTWSLLQVLTFETGAAAKKKSAAKKEIEFKNIAEKELQVEPVRQNESKESPNQESSPLVTTEHLVGSRISPKEKSWRMLVGFTMISPHGSFDLPGGEQTSLSQVKSLPTIVLGLCRNIGGFVEGRLRVGSCAQGNIGWTQYDLQLSNGFVYKDVSLWSLMAQGNANLEAQPWLGVPLSFGINPGFGYSAAIQSSSNSASNGTSHGPFFGLGSYMRWSFIQRAFLQAGYEHRWMIQRSKDFGVESGNFGVGIGLTL